MLIPHRAPDAEETMLPPGYQRIPAAVRQAAQPIMARRVGEMPGVDGRATRTRCRAMTLGFVTLGQPTDDSSDSSGGTAGTRAPGTPDSALGECLRPDRAVEVVVVVLL